MRLLGQFIESHKRGFNGVILKGDKAPLLMKTQLTQQTIKQNIKTRQT